MENRETFYPRDKIKILLLENISESTTEEFANGGYAKIKKLSGAPGENDRLAVTKGVRFVAGKYFVCAGEGQYG